MRLLLDEALSFQFPDMAENGDPVESESLGDFLERRGQLLRAECLVEALQDSGLHPCQGQGGASGGSCGSAGLLLAGTRHNGVRLEPEVERDEAAKDGQREEFVRDFFSDGHDVDSIGRPGA
mgnify:CR=1 FL=1